MEKNLDLNEIRNELDKIDDEIIVLFEERMKKAKEVAEYKIKNNMQILNSKREREIINRLSEKISPDFSLYLKVLYDQYAFESLEFQHVVHCDYKTLHHCHE